MSTSLKSQMLTSTEIKLKKMKSEHFILFVGHEHAIG